MTQIAATKENNVIVKALKKIAETKWVGNTTHENIESCLTAINLDSGLNSGWYKPNAVRISGLTGFYMVNQNGSICYDYRVIKVDDKKYKIETMTSAGFNQFENLYCQFINE